MEWLLALEKEEEFEDEVAEWRKKTTANGHVEFITLFQDRDRVVRRLAKLKPAKAKDVGYHSAAQVSEDLEARLEQKMEADIAALAIAVEDSINLAMGEATKTPTPPRGSSDEERRPARRRRRHGRRPRRPRHHHRAAREARETGRASP